jgi:RND family efflux transporter MFP subunit
MAMPPSLVRDDFVGTLDHTQPVSKVGTVAAKETVQIVPRVSGYLMNIAFKEGELVNQGDLLFEIEDTIYKINVRVAESVIQQIEAEIALARRNQERVTQLVPSRAATQQDVDEASRTVSLHEGRFEEAKARLEQAKLDLSYTKIYAPLTGRIGAKQFSVGNYLTPASGVMATIMQFDPITVTFPITERERATYFPQSGEKKPANLEILLADGTPYDGEFHIDFLDNFVDRLSGQLMVYLLCTNKDGKLFPGGYSIVRLSEQFAEAKPAVSVSALQLDGTTHFVYTIQPYEKDAPDAFGSKAGFRAIRRDVTLGPQVFDKQIITSGLATGEWVVVSGTNKIMMSGQDILPASVMAKIQAAQAALAQGQIQAPPGQTPTSLEAQEPASLEPQEQKPE